ncbi:hypothetical protein LINGRAHAP2_LOCUS2731 [Linum grandiflorum]
MKPCTLISCTYACKNLLKDTSLDGRAMPQNTMLVMIRDCAPIFSKLYEWKELKSKLNREKHSASR